MRIRGIVGAALPSCVTRRWSPMASPAADCRQNNSVICTLDDPGVAQLAAEIGNTRSAAALELWRPHLKGAIVAIGNAPTALFRLLEMLDQGAAPPAAIIGVPVGFVGAAESKQALAAQTRIPFLVVHGRRGGSAMAVAAVNALASERE